MDGLDSARWQEPGGTTLSAIEAQLVAGKAATAQWSTQPTDYATFEKVNQLCAHYGSQLEVRFYGMYQADGHFDADVLHAIPEVRRLTVDCLTSIENENALAGLTKLEDFSLGIFELADGSIVEKLPLEGLTRLILQESRKRNFDLSPLAKCRNLQKLGIHGHTRRIAAIGELQQVRGLILGGMPKGQSLDMVNAMPALRDFRLILGSRASIGELAHDTLEKLTITWVRGLESVGDLRRFPALRELIVEDQLQITAIDLQGPHLTGFRVDNCKKLDTLTGLDSLASLVWFHAARTALDLDALRDREWPTSTRSIGLFSTSRKWNDATRETLAARGFVQFPHQTLVSAD